VNRHTRTVCLSILLAIAGLLTVSGIQAAPLAQTEPPTTIYIFWGDGCPHCEDAKLFLDDLTRRYPQVQVESFEIYNNIDNRALFGKMAEAYGFEPRYVPTIFVGGQHWEGFANPMREGIEAAVRVCVENGCPDAGADIASSYEGTASSPDECVGSDVCAAPNAEGIAEDGAADTTDTPATDLQIVLFWGEGCPSCGVTKSHLETESGMTQLGSDPGGEALGFLRSLERDYPGVKVNAYEVWTTSTNVARFKRISEAYGVAARGVPTIFVGDRVWEGFSAAIGDELKTYVEHCLDAGCPSPDVDEGRSRPLPTPAANAVPAPAAPTSSGDTPAPAPAVNAITLPVLGTVDLGGHPLWVGIALISFADGSNPCSFWMPSILIALTLCTGSRRRIFTIGLIYITVTAGIYVLSIAGLFAFLTIVSFLRWIQTAVSILALFFAAISIQDYLWYKEGLSLTIADEKKPGIYKRVRKVMAAADSFWALAGATAALGAGVSLVEFSCTAGFPVVWTSLVAAQNVPPITFALLLLLYIELLYKICVMCENYVVAH